jgi:cardiolipin synthase C
MTRVLPLPYLPLLLLLLLLAGCASLPLRGADGISPSHAIVAETSAPLARMAAAALGPSSGSAFKLLPIASAAYETRLELARQARRGIDLQTFVFNGDDTGAFLLAELQRAAARGVRVRLLIDDLHTDGAQALLSDLAAFDGVEVRLVTPFTRLRGSRAAKLISSLDELRRVNHRMHNKLFIADGQLAVFGGRNIGDEYFMRMASGGNFVDLDALAAGAVVAQMGASFDRYWNSEHAWPIDLIVAPSGSIAQRRARFIAATAGLPPLEPDTGVPERLAEHASAPKELREGRLRMTPADAELIDDPVDKLASSRVANRAGTVRERIGAAMGQAQLEVFVVSPYFIPGEMGLSVIRANRERGLRLRLFTNSLAATDEPAVHAGYIEFRKPMLRAGVEIHELSSTLARRASKLGRFGASDAALHAKFVIIDQVRLFIGSMNLDGRSERYNTEVGVMIESGALAGELLSLMDYESSTWRVLLGEDGELRWVHEDGGTRTEHTSEPEASWWRHLGSRLLGALLPHDWL